MKHFQNILYVSEPSSVLMKAFDDAVELAERNNARLTVILVMEEIPPYLNRLTPYMFRQLRIKEMEALLERQRKQAAGHVEIEEKIQQGKPFLEVIQEVLLNGRDLVVKSAGDGNGMSGRLFGSTDMHLLRKCPCPVWMVKPGNEKTIGKIVAAVDFDAPGHKRENDNLNQQIIEMALSLAHRESAELHVVHAWLSISDYVYLTEYGSLPLQENINDIAAPERRLSELMDEAKNWVGQEIFDAVKPKTHAIRGIAKYVIAEQARTLGADLLVLGTVGRTGIPGFFMGNTAETILNSIDCSVLAVKPEGFVSPVKLHKD